MSKHYPVPARPLEVVTEVKKSRFIARAERADNREQALAVLERVRAAYPDARHHCWAYLLGDPAGSCDAAMNDDGEPSSTAGKPIFNVLQHKGVGDVMLVVARYFGGIKLGAGGLTRAYSSATEAVMSGLEVVRREPMQEWLLRFDFSREQAVRHWASLHEAEVGEACYSREVTLVLGLPQRLEAELRAFCRANGFGCEPCGAEPSEGS